MTFLTRVLMPLVIVVGFSGCSASNAAGPRTIPLDITASAPAEPREEAVELGSLVTLVVTSEVDGLVHVHGFEEKTDLVAGETVEVQFTANMSGAFEVETHEPDAVWVKLVVS